MAMGCDNGQSLRSDLDELGRRFDLHHHAGAMVLYPEAPRTVAVEGVLSDVGVLAQRVDEAASDVLRSCLVVRIDGASIDARRQGVVAQLCLHAAGLEVPPVRVYFGVEHDWTPAAIRDKLRECLGELADRARTAVLAEAR